MALHFSEDPLQSIIAKRRPTQLKDIPDLGLVRVILSPSPEIDKTDLKVVYVRMWVRVLGSAINLSILLKFSPSFLVLFRTPSSALGLEKVWHTVA